VFLKHKKSQQKSAFKGHKNVIYQRLLNNQRKISIMAAPEKIKINTTAHIIKKVSIIIVIFKSSKIQKFYSPKNNLKNNFSRSKDSNFLNCAIE